jgi:hypothetical protein
MNCRWRHKLQWVQVYIIFTTGLDSKRLKDVIQAPREPYDVTSAQLSIVVVQRGKICWRFGSRNWLFRRKYEKSKHKKLNFLLFNSMLKYVIYRLMHDFFHIRTVIIPKDRYRPEGFIWKRACINLYSNMTSFKRFESKPINACIFHIKTKALWPISVSRDDNRSDMEKRHALIYLSHISTLN